MSKTAINNEIVLMRQAVRKSRVSVVRKLIKEAKLLEARKHGDEKVLKKCKRKAEKLVAEINAAKKIKDDDISKFGLTETRELQEILNDPDVTPSTRIMARLVFHKFLRDRILQFKEKFPSYEEFLGPGRKKMSKLARKAKREERNHLKHIGTEMDESTSQAQLDAANKDISEEKVDDIKNIEYENRSIDNQVREYMEEDTTNSESSENTLSEGGYEPGSILRIKTSEPVGKKMKTAIPSEPEKCASAKSPTRVSKTVKITTNSPPRVKRAIPIKVISEEATVERFADLMEKKESSEIVEKSATDKIPRKGIMIEKQIDSFFLSENGESEYMSVVVPKSVDHEEENQGDQFHQNNRTRRQKTFHEKNDKFFNKINQPKKGEYANRFTYNTDKYSRNDDRSKEKLARSEKDKVAMSRNIKQHSEKRLNVKEEEQVHPSWQARKKQQEILKQGFKGKRIVFDD